MCSDKPSPWIERWARLIAPGRPVLDVAAGKGRHTALMMGRGHPVTAVDRDVSALQARFDRADAALQILETDLEGADPWPFPGEMFGGVIVTRYLHRPLFPALLASLEPGGVLLYETFMAGQERYGKPSNPDFLLRSGELLDVARAGGLSVVAYEAGPVAEPLPSVLQRIAARRAWHVDTCRRRWRDTPVRGVDIPSKRQKPMPGVAFRCPAWRR